MDQLDVRHFAFDEPLDHDRLTAEGRGSLSDY